MIADENSVVTTESIPDNENNVSNAVNDMIGGLENIKEISSNTSEIATYRVVSQEMEIQLQPILKNLKLLIHLEFL